MHFNTPQHSIISQGWEEHLLSKQVSLIENIMDLHISSDPVLLQTLISYLYYDLSLLILVLFYFFPPEFLPLRNFKKNDVSTSFAVSHFVVLSSIGVIYYAQMKLLSFRSLSSRLVYSAKSYLLLFHSFTFRCIVSLHRRFPLMCVACFKVVFIDIKPSEACVFICVFRQLFFLWYSS